MNSYRYVSFNLRATCVRPSVNVPFFALFWLKQGLWDMHENYITGYVCIHYGALPGQRAPLETGACVCQRCPRVAPRARTVSPEA